MFWGGCTDVRMDHLCENSDHYLPGLWSAPLINWSGQWSTWPALQSGLWPIIENSPFQDTSDFFLKFYQCGKRISISAKAGSIDDPLGQPTHHRQWIFVVFHLILKKKWRRKDAKCEYNDHCRPCVGRPSGSTRHEVSLIQFHSLVSSTCVILLQF